MIQIIFFYFVLYFINMLLNRTLYDRWGFAMFPFFWWLGPFSTILFLFFLIVFFIFDDL